ncbi:MAG: lamin tail domain-containing protein [Myxococcota bacterium]
MRRLVFPLILALCWVAPAQATIIISEYVDGGGKDQAIELYNYGSIAIDITGWMIDIYLDGSTVVTRSVTLSGSIDPGDVFVIARNKADAEILAVADLVDKNVKYNGNDAIVLTDGTDPIDRVGQVGFDPGTEWGSGDLSTKDNTIQRDIGANPDPGIFNLFSLADWGGWPDGSYGGLGFPGVQLPESPTHVMILMGLIPMGMLRARARRRGRISIGRLQSPSRSAR